MVFSSELSGQMTRRCFSLLFVGKLQSNFKPSKDFFSIEVNAVFVPVAVVFFGEESKVFERDFLVKSSST